MATAPATTSHPNLLSTHRALLSTLTSFLTVSVHQILYLRHLYPPASFLLTRAYNYPVRQNRHPAVCAWINDAITSIALQLAKNTVSLASLCIHDLSTNTVLERWYFDLHSLPTIAKRDRDVPFATPASENDDPLPQPLNLADLEATFRAGLSRLSSTSARLSPLPSGPGAPELTFTLTIELRPTADRPVGRLEEAERRWIVAEDAPTPPSAGPASTSQDPTKSAEGQSPKQQQQQHQQPREGKTHPIRRLDAAPLHIEMWVEESAHKLSGPWAIASQERDAATRAAEASYGAGTEQFDPTNGYADLEGTGLNRKPGGGAMTDYQRM